MLQSSIAWASGKHWDAKAKAMFQAAYDASEIKTKGSPPFHMKADFQYANSDFHMTKGSYEEIWMSPDQHRTAFSIPSGSDVIVVSNGQRWQKSALPYKILVETIVDEITDLGMGLHYGPPHKIKKIQDKKLGQRHMACVVPRFKDYEDDYCFDPQNGRLVWRTELMCGVEYQFSDYEPWGGKWVPRKVDVMRDGSAVVHLVIKSLTAPGPLTPSTFAPPPGADVEKHVTCQSDELKGGDLIKTITPTYPMGYHDEGVVRFYADIGEQGQIRGLDLVQSASSVMDAEALQSVRKWRFNPLVCKGVPREFVRRLSVGFGVE